MKHENRQVSLDKTLKMLEGELKKRVINQTKILFLIFNSLEAYNISLTNPTLILHLITYNVITVNLVKCIFINFN